MTVALRPPKGAQCIKASSVQDVRRHRAARAAAAHRTVPGGLFALSQYYYVLPHYELL